jgi:hypothetical protein
LERPREANKYLFFDVPLHLAEELRTVNPIATLDDASQPSFFCVVAERTYKSSQATVVCGYG